MQKLQVFFSWTISLLKGRLWLLRYNLQVALSMVVNWRDYFFDRLENSRVLRQVFTVWPKFLMLEFTLRHLPHTSLP